MAVTNKLLGDISHHLYELLTTYLFSFFALFATMDEQFELPVEFKGQQLMLKASLQVIGYAHKFNVEVNGQNIMFEPDEERNYRAVIPYNDINNKIFIDKELVKVIAASIEEIVR